MSFRFVHTADIHLDSPLQSLALKQPEIAELIASATRQAFIGTIDLCLEESVDALLIAGDLYDGDLRSIKSASFFTIQMQRLADANIDVYIIRGNHDAVSKISKSLQLPENVHVFQGHDKSFEVEGKNTALHGISFAKQAAPDSLLPRYPKPVEGAINIGLLHTSLGGSGAHHTYAPCGIDDLIAQGYDYWALGHIHKAEVHRDASPAIVMPGNPQGRHINEAGSKSVSLVEISDDHQISISQHSTAIAQFERLTVDLTGVDDWREMTGAVEEKVAQLQPDIKAEHLIIRLELVGETDLNARMRRNADVLAQDLALAAQRHGSVFFEQVDIKTRRPQAATAAMTTAINSDPLVELRKIAGAGNFRQTIVDHEFTQLYEELQSKLPPDLRDDFDLASDNGQKHLEQLFANGLEAVISRLEGEDI